MVFRHVRYWRFSFRFECASGSASLPFRQRGIALHFIHRPPRSPGGCASEVRGRGASCARIGIVNWGRTCSASTVKEKKRDLGLEIGALYHDAASAASRQAPRARIRAAPGYGDEVGALAVINQRQCCESLTPRNEPRSLARAQMAHIAGLLPRRSWRRASPAPPRSAAIRGVGVAPRAAASGVTPFRPATSR